MSNLEDTLKAIHIINNLPEEDCLVIRAYIRHLLDGQEATVRALKDCTGIMSSTKIPIPESVIEAVRIVTGGALGEDCKPKEVIVTKPEENKD